MKKRLSDPKLRLMKAAQASPSIKKRKGTFLVEASISLFILVAIAIVLADASLNILQPRSWVMRQNLVDAYLSQEVAEANRVDFGSIGNSTFDGWGTADAFNAAATLTDARTVTLGLLPGFTAGTGNGRVYEGQVRRQLTELQGAVATPDFRSNTDGGAVSLADLGIQAYKLQSHVSYVIDGQTYIKSRTVIRSE
jgi:hypothetical protein